MFPEPPPAFPRPTPTFPHSTTFSGPQAPPGRDPFARTPFGYDTGHAPPPPAFADAPGEPGASWAGFALPPDDPMPPPAPPVDAPDGPARPGTYVPEPARSGRPALLVVGAVVLALVLGGGATLLAVQPWSSANAQGPIGQGPVQGGTGTYDTTPPTSSAPSASPSDPATQLVETAAADERSIDSTVGEGMWVPQISSKFEGLRAKGIVYDAAAIWSDHYALRTRYGGMLLDSSNYATFTKGGSYWVTIVPSEATSSPDVANAWCDSQGLSSDDCYAKRIGHRSYTDTTRLRG